MANEMLTAALAYAERGWAILPVKFDKTPYTRNAVGDATTNVATIKSWWSRWPDANIALNVGEANMMVLSFACEFRSLFTPLRELGMRTPLVGFLNARSGETIEMLSRSNPSRVLYVIGDSPATTQALVALVDMEDGVEEQAAQLALSHRFGQIQEELELVGAGSH